MFKLTHQLTSCDPNTILTASVMLTANWFYNQLIACCLANKVHSFKLFEDVLLTQNDNNPAFANSLLLTC